MRLGLHTGEPVVGEEGYTGLDVVRAARIAADGEGGQILLSEATRAIVGGNLPEGVGIRELGERKLKDIDRPEPLFELVYAPESPAAAESAKPVDSAPAAQSAVQVAPAEVSFDVKPGNVFKQWQRMARLAFDAAKNDDDPGRVIEERVLSELKKTFGDAIIIEGKNPKVKPPAPPTVKPAKLPAKSGGSVADGLARLNALREAGALSDEQYSKAVDRLLAEG